LDQGQTAEIAGRSADGLWWVIKVEAGKDTEGWVAAAYATVQNGGSVPVIEPK
jgi:hypothetical protein